MNAHHDALSPAGEQARRHALRRRLLDARSRFAGSVGFAPAQERLGRHLVEVLEQLEPHCLGLYCAVRHEFNAAVAIVPWARRQAIECALPFCTRSARELGAAGAGDPGMHYRRWDGQAPTSVDACGIPCSDGSPVVPDVVLVPCLGFTDAGYRIGYGAGFFDRWMAAHPGVTAVGVAWRVARVDAGAFEALPHDQPLALVVSEAGVEPVQESAGEQAEEPAEEPAERRIEVASAPIRRET